MRRRIVVGTGIPDDHCTPAVLAETDAPPIVMWDQHNATKELTYRKGTGAPLDFAALGPERTITLPNVASYKQIYRIAGNELIVFARSGNTKWCFARSHDYGETWDTTVPWLNFGGANQGYMTTVRVGNVVRVAAYGHPTSSTIRDIFYATIDLASGVIAKVDGTVIGNLDGTSLPISISNLGLAFDVPDGTGSRLFDVSAATNPEIAFATWLTDTDTMYRYLRWDGAAWQVHDIVAGGVVFGDDPTMHYNGGVCFPNPTAGGTLYLARESAGNWTVEKRVTADNGATWATTIMRSGPTKKARPYCPVDRVSGPEVIWHEVTTYSDYEHYSASLVRAA